MWWLRTTVWAPEIVFGRVLAGEAVSVRKESMQPHSTDIALTAQAEMTNAGVCRSQWGSPPPGN